MRSLKHLIDSKSQATEHHNTYSIASRCSVQFLSFSMTEENFRLTQIESTIVDQFLNVSKEFANFANLFTQKVKILSTHESHDHTIYIKKSHIAF